MANTEKWREQKAKVDRFVARFGSESYRLLARYAALPLVLTPELVNYLRNEFLRGEGDVPWEAEVDLLLSDLCSQVGYELYAMDTQVRAYLLEEAQDSPLWQQRMREVAQVLISYVNFLSRVNPEQRRQELEAQRLAAMVYLGDETCQKAAQEIAERLKQVSDSAATGKLSEKGVRAELARLTRITQELAPQLEKTPALIEYAKLVQRVLRHPEAVSSAELQQAYQVGDVTLAVSPRFLRTHAGLTEELTVVEGFPPLLVLEFETGQLVEQKAIFPLLQTQTVESVTLFFDDQPAPLKPQTVNTLRAGIGMSVQITDQVDLHPFSFEVATIERTRSAKDSWKIKRRSGEAYLYEEQLGEAVHLEIVAIPSGIFMMGSPKDESESSEDERPQHEVKLKDFYMSRYPITQEQWRFVAALPSVDRELDLDPSSFKGDTRPVEQVSWFDVVEFCKRLSQFTNRAYRLPSEAEWEYACRAGTTTPFHFGETISPDLANYYSSDSYNGGPKRKLLGETTLVDQFGIANAFGLCDMHGNVWEWCADNWHDNYAGAPTDGSAWLSGNENHSHVLRGGSWYDGPEDCRSAYRRYVPPDFRNDLIGFRVVCSAPRTL